MTKKYVLTKEKKVEFGLTFFRIKANVSFGIVAKGELGGWIEKEDNLDQEGNAWVSGNARVYGNAHCEFGWYFAYKEKDWSITEVPSGEGMLLVNDYQPPTEQRGNPHW